MVVLAGLDDAVVAGREAERIVELAILLRHAGHAVAVVDERVFDLFVGRNVVGHEVEVEVTVAIVVGEGGHGAGADVVEAEVFNRVRRRCRRPG